LKAAEEKEGLLIIIMNAQKIMVVALVAMATRYPIKWSWTVPTLTLIRSVSMERKRSDDVEAIAPLHTSKTRTKTETRIQTRMHSSPARNELYIFIPIAIFWQGLN
jgi:hypothetical protein